MNIVVGLWIQSFLILEGLKALTQKASWELAWSVTEPRGMRRVDCVIACLGNHNNLEVKNKARSFLDGYGHRVPMIAFLSERTDLLSLADLNKVGIRGVLSVHASEDEIRAAVVAVHNGNCYQDPRLVIAGPGFSALNSEPIEPLTIRERWILQLLAKGLRVKEVAAQLNISHKTVETHKYNLMRKLGIHKQSGLTAYAIQQGIVELPGVVCINTGTNN